MHLTISLVLAFIFPQTQALPTNDAPGKLRDSRIYTCFFGGRTTGCVTRVVGPLLSPAHLVCPLLEWYTDREFGVINIGCTIELGAQPNCWSCCMDITPVI
ncbi:hypothetical protein N7491_004865 [Penicillium cf. griseofulvum]|uniref:Hydrophobin n=1 Tax=Penicillium cf. griseofulvum TaxID=2972120 RepID=A0A9W9M4K1_9EURO|nr:hypothetical protein N7472_007558 [Penicillium cf. griseofulvum]KAJ5434270.1 hypothetical protein N7491_004865 [Penicillium cf. griseofulvum]KAJ5452100.1 hypothetical protein N7445_000283 [Penicillium cf. griseofulvum]